MIVKQESLTAKMTLKDLTVSSPLPAANLVLVFGSVKRFGESKLESILKTRYPAAQIIGCSTSGEITAEGVFDDSLQITAILWEKTIQRVTHTKMSGMQKEQKQLFVGESKKFWKRFFSKKRRQILNQNNEEKL